MAIADLLLRATANLPLVTKGSELTLSEGDANVIEIYNALAALMAGTGIYPYNPATAYSGTFYVSYSGNIYVHVAVGPSTGITPGTNPAVWQLTSVGALAHQQNTDLALAFGTSNYITAATIYEHINNQVIILANSAAFLALVTASTLKTNRIYFLAAEKIAIRSIGAAAYSNKGYYAASIPNLDTTDLYDGSATYGIGDKVHWSGLVYNNITGTNDAIVPPSDPTNWTLVAQYTADYKNLYFDCEIANAGGTIGAILIWDHFGNNVYQNSGVFWMIGRAIQVLNRFIGFQNTIQSFNSEGDIIGNVLINNSTITLEGSTTGDISENVLEQASFDGEIISPGKFSFNKLKRVQVAAPEGLSVEVSNLEIELVESAVLNLNQNHSLTSGYLKPTGGNIILPCDADNTSTGTVLEIANSAHLHTDVYGVYEIEDSTATAWAKLSGGFNYDIVYKIIAKKGTSLQLQTTLWAGKTVDDILYDGGILTLIGDAEDFVEVRKITVSGVNYHQVVRVQIQD